MFIAPLLSNTGAGSPEKTDSCTVQVSHCLLVDFLTQLTLIFIFWYMYLCFMTNIKAENVKKKNTARKSAKPPVPSVLAGRDILPFSIPYSPS